MPETTQVQGNIYLIGLMGAGKTTVGRKLAALMGCEFIDTDHALEQRTGVSVSHIFEIEGEQGFREREAKLLAETSRAPHPSDSANPAAGAVIATGGGVILREGNRKVMHHGGQVVYLRAPLELLWRRLQDCNSRPLLRAPDPKNKVAQLLEERDPLYAAEADFIVDVRADSPSKVAQEIQALLQSHENR